jgi:hypothetical protein
MIVVQVSLGKKERPSKNKKAGGVAQAVECLPKHEALNSNPSTAKKKKTHIKETVGTEYLYSPEMHVGTQNPPQPQIKI